MTIKEARHAAGLTQKVLAEKSGVNIRLIQKLESGEAKLGNITAKNYLAITRTLAIDPYDLELFTD